MNIELRETQRFSCWWLQWKGLQGVSSVEILCCSFSIVKVLCAAAVCVLGKACPSVVLRACVASVVTNKSWPKTRICPWATLLYSQLNSTHKSKKDKKQKTPLSVWKNCLSLRRNLPVQNGLENCILLMTLRLRNKGEVKISEATGSG